MNSEDIKTAYLKAETKYRELLPKYRDIYKMYYPDEYAQQKEMVESGALRQYTYKERYTGLGVYAHFPEFYEDKKDWGEIPANYYDPINLRFDDPGLCDKFNYYGWEDFKDRPPLPHFDMTEETSDFLILFDGIIRFLHDFEWITNNFICYRCNRFGEPYEEKFTDISRYTDSRTVHYEHEDIIITDPCYVMRSDAYNDNDWDRCGYGSKMENLGSFTEDKYATADTIYGDWGCTTYNLDTDEEIGSFCADAGLVSVFSLEQVQAYNPKYDPMKSPWCATVIRDFTGDVTLKTKFDEATCEITRYVEGRGSVNFIGTQTGL